jgi:hypothetical protein
MLDEGDSCTQAADKFSPGSPVRTYLICGRNGVYREERVHSLAGKGSCDPRSRDLGHIIIEGGVSLDISQADCRFE